MVDCNTYLCVIMIMMKKKKKKKQKIYSYANMTPI